MAALEIRRYASESKRSNNSPHPLRVLIALRSGAKLKAEAAFAMGNFHESLKRHPDRRSTAGRRNLPHRSPRL